MEWSFLTLGTGGGVIFGRGMKLFAIIRWGMKLSRNIFMGYKTILFFIKCLCFCKVCDIHLLNEALGAYLHNIQHPKCKMHIYLYT